MLSVCKYGQAIEIKIDRNADKNVIGTSIPRHYQSNANIVKESISPDGYKLSQNSCSHLLLPAVPINLKPSFREDKKACHT